MLLNRMKPALSSYWSRKKQGAKTVTGQFFSQTTPAPRCWSDWLGYAGTVLAVLLVVQVVTGLLLWFHYQPIPARAFASLTAIKNQAPNGFLFHAVHTMGAKLIVLVLFVHMFKVMLASAYRGPRAHTWYTGSALFFLMLFTGFSGYLLPWSQQSYWACVVGTESLRLLPGIGPWIVEVLRGGPAVAGPTLTRFYWLHILVLPLSIVVLVWFHIKRVWNNRLSGPPESVARADLSACIGCGTCARICPFDAVRMLPAGQEDERPRPAFHPDLCNACRQCLDKCPANCIDLEDGQGPVVMEPIFPQGYLRRVLLCTLVLMVLFGGVYFLPEFFLAEKTPADPMLTPDRIKPDWYFLGPYQLLKVLPSEFWGLMAQLFLFVLIVLLPVLDKKGPRDPLKRPLFQKTVWAGIWGFFLFTIWGYLS